MCFGEFSLVSVQYVFMCDFCVFPCVSLRSLLLSLDCVCFRMLLCILLCFHAFARIPMCFHAFTCVFGVFSCVCMFCCVFRVFRRLSVCFHRFPCVCCISLCFRVFGWASVCLTASQRASMFFRVSLCFRVFLLFSAVPAFFRAFCMGFHVCTSVSACCLVLPCVAFRFLRFSGVCLCFAVLPCVSGGFSAFP